MAPLFLKSQVLNIEDERIKTDTTGWSGSAAAGINLMKSTDKLTDLSGKIHLQYKSPNSLYLILSNFNFIKAGKTNFSNNGIQHLRYNYTISDWLVAEAFAQAQFNKIIGIKFRSLFGAGPRFKVVKTDPFRLYAAWLYMYEYEEMELETLINRSHRISSYVSFTLKLNKNVRIINTTYFQPLVNNFADYRLSSETDFVIKISKKLAYALNYNYYFDSEPPANVPQTIYSITNKISLSF